MLHSLYDSEHCNGSWKKDLEFTVLLFVISAIAQSHSISKQHYCSYLFIYLFQSLYDSSRSFVVVFHPYFFIIEMNDKMFADCDVTHPTSCRVGRLMVADIAGELVPLNGAIQTYYCSSAVFIK